MCAVIRGDVHWIRVGRRTSIQDGAVVHAMIGTHPTSIGDNVTIGHAAVIHGCTIENLCLIGMGAILLNGAHVGAGSIVAAGTRALGSLLFGVSPIDLPTLGAAAILLAAVAVGASYIPARSAARTDPMAALRAE